MWFALLALASAGTCPALEPLEPDVERLASSSPAPESGTAGLVIHVLEEGDAARHVAGMEVDVRGPDGFVRAGTTGPEGRLELDGLPAGTYEVQLVDHVPLQVRVELREGRTALVQLESRGSALEAPPPGSPPTGRTWLRYERTGCLGPCPLFAVTVDREGLVSFSGEGYVRRTGTVERALSPRRQLQLQDALACARTRHSFPVQHATDFPTARLEVWEADGSSWSWVWYGGDFRAPRAEAERLRRRLERAMGVARFL